jgi:hypothetical protein
VVPLGGRTRACRGSARFRLITRIKNCKDSGGQSTLNSIWRYRKAGKSRIEAILSKVWRRFRLSLIFFFIRNPKKIQGGKQNYPEKIDKISDRIWAWIPPPSCPAVRRGLIRLRLNALSAAVPGGLIQRGIHADYQTSSQSLSFTEGYAHVAAQEAEQVSLSIYFMTAAFLCQEFKSAVDQSAVPTLARIYYQATESIPY